MLKADAFKRWCKNMLNYRKFGCLATISFCLLKSSTRSLLHCYSIGSSQSCTQVSSIKFSGARLQIWTHFSSLAVSSASFPAYKAKRHGGKITLILLHNTQFWHDKWKPCNRIKPFQLSVFSPSLQSTRFLRSNMLTLHLSSRRDRLPKHAKKGVVLKRLRLPLSLLTY